MLAVCAALKWEVRPVLRALGRVERLHNEALPLWRGVDKNHAAVLVFRTGIGPEKAAANTRRVLERFSVKALINTGCAGGLTPGLSVGSLVIPDEVLLAGTPTIARGKPSTTWARRLREAAEKENILPERGPLLTSPKGLATSEAKREAHGKFGAVAVDMESAAVGLAAAETGVPFAAMRAVLDPLATELPASSADILRPDGTVRPLRAALSLARAPISTLSLASASRVVEKVLARIFCRLFLHG